MKNLAWRAVAVCGLLAGLAALWPQPVPAVPVVPSASSAPFVPAPAPAPDTVALGLIVGFRSPPEQPAGLAAQAAGREPTAQAAWEHQAQRGRERLKQVATEAGLPVQGVGEAGNAHWLRFDRPLRGQALQDALRRARLHPDVAWVEPNVLLKRLQTTPNDPGFAQQWHLQTPALGGVSAINLPPAWALSTGSAGITVAVLDTGILPHPDLAGRVWPGYDFVSEVAYANDGDGRDPDPSDAGDWVSASGNDPAVQQMVKSGTCAVADSSWHGTFIAGQIAAVTHNGLGIAGINWANKVLPVRVAGKCGALLSDMLDGMRWAAGLPVAGVPANPNPARVINLSFGGDVPCASNALYQSAIDDVTAQGALVVVAGGNSASALMRPADCQRVLSVGAVRQDGLKTDYSSFGPSLGLMAPGGSSSEGAPLYSTRNTGRTSAVPAQDHYDHLQGSSFAAPLAAGVASLMLSLNPALSPAQLVDRLRAGVRPWSSVPQIPTYPTCSNARRSQQECNCTTDTCGPGLLDADRAVRLALGPAVVIAAPGTVAPGARVALDGRQSVAIPDATLASFAWQQLEGPPVPIGSATDALASVTLAPGPATYVFELTVTDSMGRSGRDHVSVRAAAPPGGGGGASGWLWGLALWWWAMATVTATARAARHSPYKDRSA
jgi:serine protease